MFSVALSFPFMSCYNTLMGSFCDSFYKPGNENLIEIQCKCRMQNAWLPIKHAGCNSQSIVYLQGKSAKRNISRLSPNYQLHCLKPTLKSQVSCLHFWKQLFITTSALTSGFRPYYITHFVYDQMTNTLISLKTFLVAIKQFTVISCEMHFSIPAKQLFLPNPQVYDVKQGSNLVEKIRLFIHKVTAPLHPKVDANRPQTLKSLSHPFSREKQHLWVKPLLTVCFYFYFYFFCKKKIVCLLATVFSHVQSRQ